MKLILLTTFLIAMLLSCKQQEEITIEKDYCTASIATIDAKKFRGTIYICNAQPPEMAFWPGEAEVSLVNDTAIQVYLQADAADFDTILHYALRCYIVEDSGTCIKIFDAANQEVGGYNDPLFIQFGFGYRGCLHNTFFEGMVDAY